MPRFMFDDHIRGVAVEADVPFDELPHTLVAAMAERGDMEAILWLEAHPLDDDED